MTSAQIEVGFLESERPQTGMSVRITITLPDGVGKDLEQWAIADNNKPATLAAFVVEQAVRNAKASGLIPSHSAQVANCSTISQLIAHFWDKLSNYERIPSDRLKALRNGESAPSSLEIARIALCLGVTEALIEEVADRSTSRSG